MSLIKKVDVEEHFAARRAMKLGRVRPMGQLPKTAAVGRTGTSAKAPLPGGNVISGPSSPGVPAVVIPIVAGTSARDNRTLPGSRQK
jgi:hypothetical protein